MFHNAPSRGRRRALSPAEVSAELLRHLVRRAEAYLGARVEGAVIAVPAYFDDAQRTATAEAGRLAGLSSVQLLQGARAKTFLRLRVSDIAASSDDDTSGQRATKGFLQECICLMLCSTSGFDCARFSSCSLVSAPNCSTKFVLRDWRIT